MEPLLPVNGINSWTLPADLPGGAVELRIDLLVSETVTPAEISNNADDRTLGIGLRALRVLKLDPQPARLDEMISLGADSVDPRMMSTGWHMPESWGCWTNGTDATMHLMFEKPLTGSFRLELDLVPPPTMMPVTVRLNDHVLPSRIADNGRNAWVLPRAVTQGVVALLVHLNVEDTFSPAQSEGSRDDRTLGIGVKAIGLFRTDVTMFRLEETVRISQDAPTSGVLQAGWHKSESWGVWSNGPRASLWLDFEGVLQGGLALELDMVPPLADRPVRIVVNDVALPATSVKNGVNRWVIPRKCSDGVTTLRVEVRIDRAARPSEVKQSDDRRMLGVGIRSICVRRLESD